MNPKEYYSHFPKEEKYYTLIDFFYFVSKHDFKKVIGYVSKEIGYSDGIKGVFFPSSFEKWDEEYFEEGVLVFVNDREVNINYRIFFEYLVIAKELYVEVALDDDEELSYLIEAIQRNSQINS